MHVARERLNEKGSTHVTPTRLRTRPDDQRRRTIRRQRATRRACRRIAGIPPAPLGYDEGASESLHTTMTVTPPTAADEQWYDPSEGESATGTNMPPRGRDHLSLPGEDS